MRIQGISLVQASFFFAAGIEARCNVYTSIQCTVAEQTDFSPNNEDDKH